MQGPTAEECSDHATVEYDGISGTACWYPQMGGYIARAIVVPDHGCFDVMIWHDGEFPFKGEDPDQPPVRLHHCDADQFIEFGEFVKSLQR